MAKTKKKDKPCGGSARRSANRKAFLDYHIS